MPLGGKAPCVKPFSFISPPSDSHSFLPLAEPWWHVIIGAAGAYAFYRLASTYDDTTDALNKLYSSSARLPSWMHSQLSQEQLGERGKECGAQRGFKKSGRHSMVSHAITRCVPHSLFTSSLLFLSSSLPCLHLPLPADSELRAERVKEYHAKYAQLAALEEKEFLERKEASRAEGKMQ